MTVEEMLWEFERDLERYVSRAWGGQSSMKAICQEDGSGVALFVVPESMYRAVHGLVMKLEEKE